MSVPFLQPMGKKYPLEMHVGEMMENKIVVALKAVIVNQGKILILRRSGTDEVGPGEWETVGGKVEFGEDLETALVREIQEEAGIEVSVEKLIYAVTFLTDPNRQIVLLSYLCRTNQSAVTLSTEHSEYMWATKSEVTQYLPKAIIEDFNKHNVLKMPDLI